MLRVSIRALVTALLLADLLQTVSHASVWPQNLSHYVERAGHHFCVVVGCVDPVRAEIMMSLCSE